MKSAVAMLVIGLVVYAGADEVSGDAAGGDVIYPESSDQLFPTNEEGGLDGVHWNEVVDYLLRLTNNRTLSKGRDEVALPDIHKTFTRKVGILTLRGEFEARRGHLKGLSRVRRTGDVSVLRSGSSMTLTTTVGLEDPKLDYDFYRVDLHNGPSMSGAIEGEVTSNAVEVTVTMDLTETSCATRLDEVKVVELGELKVKVHRLGLPFDYLLSRITTWLTRVFKTDVQRLLQRTLASELDKGLKRSRCEKYATHFILIDPK